MFIHSSKNYLFDTYLPNSGYTMVNRTDCPSSQGYYSMCGEPTLIKYLHKHPCLKYYEHYINTPTKPVGNWECANGTWYELRGLRKTFLEKSIWARIRRVMVNWDVAVNLYLHASFCTKVMGQTPLLPPGTDGAIRRISWSTVTQSLWNLQNDTVVCRALWAVLFQKDLAPSLCFQVTRLAWECFVTDREKDYLSSKQLSLNTSDPARCFVTT